jgi:hypothetical protein
VSVFPLKSILVSSAIFAVAPELLQAEVNASDNKGIANNKL